MSDCTLAVVVLAAIAKNSKIKHWLDGPQQGVLLALRPAVNRLHSGRHRFVDSVGAMRRLGKIAAHLRKAVTKFQQLLRGDEKLEGMLRVEQRPAGGDVARVLGDVAVGAREWLREDLPELVVGGDAALQKTRAGGDGLNGRREFGAEPGVVGLKRLDPLVLPGNLVAKAANGRQDVGVAAGSSRGGRSSRSRGRGSHRLAVVVVGSRLGLTAP